MDLEKYNKVPNEFATAKEIGLAAATLTAMARRGLVEIKETTPKQYRKSNNSSVKIYKLCEENKNNYETYFTLYKLNKEIGMLCSISKGTIVDCRGKPYDLTNVNKIRFGKKEVLIF